ncbi:FMN-binding negative transcriptional regulator [Methylocystis heyeri]|uniref:FMN-binding negative transcriptional regulator n=1 Tax=Methylocystis heyeri TaxID=391905 RepID=A0A6B8KIL5_9HYPH|nr:FMN-binding negative transcriptional regulator [Methylocystis heyeri]QGM46358.1 FMN-binding negative transcriptional regulator [Methylocystis heyeri]
MYLPENFREQDAATIAAIIGNNPLGALVTVQNGALVADHIPFLLDSGRNRLLAHVARANPLWRLADRSQDALAIFQGGDRYVTPSWYPSKRRTGRVAPTWNYEVVHVYGRLVAHDDELAARETIEKLTREHEERRPAPWAVGDAPEDYVSKLLKAIVAIEIDITRIEAKRKLSQNRSAEDREGVIAGLEEEDNDAARDMARRMREREV